MLLSAKGEGLDGGGEGNARGLRVTEELGITNTRFGVK